MSVEQYPIKPDDKEIHIEFDQVSFNYNGENTDKLGDEEDSTCVENIAFRLKQGESLGIIGATGAGKTTIINLLMRYYDVTTGGIYMNGRNIKTIPLQQLRQKFGVVFQNDTIFKDTILGNINLNRNISLERAQQAAKDAQAAEFISQLGLIDENDLIPVENTADTQNITGNHNNGLAYDYPVAIKGANLSGGQKQRLLVSRALAGNPEILILDDSSSALDYKTDANLRNAIKKHYKPTTILMVAQRISSIMHMDQIIVLEDGKIIGQGKHEDLLQKCDVYSEIYESQMGNK